MQISNEMTAAKPKPMLSHPTFSQSKHTYGNAISQSEIEAETCNRREARENTCKPSYDWFRLVNSAHWRKHHNQVENIARLS